MTQVTTPLLSAVTRHVTRFKCGWDRNAISSGGKCRSITWHHAQGWAQVLSVTRVTRVVTTWAMELLIWVVLMAEGESMRIKLNPTSEVGDHS